MLVIIPKVLNSKELEQAGSLINKGPFVDGRLSAGASAKKVKGNEELPANSPQLEQLNALVMPKLVQHPIFQAAVIPLRVATPFYARYTQGMAYGDHIDDPVMGPPGGQYRSDISTSIFLNEPDQYEGGELLIRTPFGNQRIKLGAGDAVIYPSSSLHQVSEVTSGERLVAVTWAQSMVRSAEQRELLYQLFQTRESLLENHPKADEAKEIDYVYVNLMRMWSEV